MATDTKQVEEQETEAATDSESVFALLFQLDGVATDARRAAYDVLSSILGDDKVKFSEAQFSRHCLLPSPQRYIPALLEELGAKTNAKKLAEDVTSGVVMNISKTSALRPGFTAVLDEAKKRNITIGAITALPEAQAETVIKKLGLDKWEVTLFAAEEQVDDVYPRTDTLIKIAKAMKMSQRRCAVLAGDRAGARAALSAGMRCAVTPDSFTSFQDFGGADLIVDSLADLSPAEILDTLLPPE